MSVDAAEPEEPEDQDEYLADDDTPVVAIPIEIKKSPHRGMSRKASEELSATMWEEYASGMSQNMVADLHGVSRGTVHRRLREHRKRIGIEDIEEAKSLDLGRYEALIERVWRKTFEEPTPENVRMLAMLMDQRAKLLGLNAPRKLQVDGTMEMNPSPAFLGQLDRLVEQRERLMGTTSRPVLEAPDAEVVDAELVDGDD